MFECLSVWSLTLFPSLLIITDSSGPAFRAVLRPVLRPVLRAELRPVLRAVLRPVLRAELRAELRPVFQSFDSSVINNIGVDFQTNYVCDLFIDLSLVFDQQLNRRSRQTLRDNTWMLW